MFYYKKNLDVKFLKLKNSTREDDIQG